VSAPLSASGDLLRSLLALADAHLVFARELALPSAALPQAFQWAVAAVGLREREPVHAALGFLSHLLGAASKALTASAAGDSAAGAGAAGGDAAAALQRCVGDQGEALVRALVLGACDTAPRALLRPLAGVLHQLLQPTLGGDAAAAWLLSALSSPDLPGLAAGLLRPADAETFARLALRRPLLPRGRFDALVMDFAALPRGEGTADALLAYELV
jgi:Importin 13 repeat